MATAVMQRLHNVRQLGLAHLVYPGANYSRFSHSVGACHNAANLLDAISRNKSPLDEKVCQEYRLVALLHDVGHYPFSHATETVISNFYAEDLLSESSFLVADDDPITSQSTKTPASYHHEPLGEFLIRNDPEIAAVLRANGFEPDDIADRFSKAKPDNLIGIISSDLDCDRLDYLKRTAHNSGAPYGSVDIRFLIDQATLDKDGIFCFRGKAARSADHLLISRFYDYIQIPFNKTVAALEWSLVTCLEELLRREALNCSGKAVEEKILSSEWKHFDDQMVIAHLRNLLPELKKGSAIRDHATAILDRKPAKLIAAWDEIIHSEGTKAWTQAEYIARNIVEKVASDFSIDPARLYIWKVPVRFSKLDIHQPGGGMSEEQIAEAVQILDERTGKAILLASRKDTLIHRLCSYSMAGLRLYYMPENGELSEEVKNQIIDRFRDVLGPPSF